MSNNDFMLDVIAKLNKQLSKAQLKKDLKGIDNTLSVKVIAKLATALSKKQLGDSLKQLNNLYVQVGTKFKTDKDTRNKLLNEITQLQKNLTELQLKVNVEKGASQSAISSVISTAKTAQRYADKTSITLDVEVRKEKAVNDILYIGQKYSKLFSNLSASQKYENLLNSAYSISDKSQLQEVRAQISAFTSELKAGGLAAESTGKKWGKLIDRAKELFSAASIIRTVFVQAKQAVSTTIDLDKVYTDLVKVNDELNRNDYADYLSRCNQKAQELATTQKALIEGATEFSKSGYDLSTSDALTEKSTILANVGDMSASDSAKAIISGVQAYDVVDGYTDVVNKAQALIDKYNEVGNTASIMTSEIAQGVQKVGSVFADSNTSVDEFIALLASANRQYQDADNLSLALRTAALRIRGCTAELEVYGEETDDVYTSTAKLAEKIEGLTSINGSGGVKILEADGETFRSIYDIFLDISKVYQDMSDTDASALLELIAGKNRASAISATLNNMTEAQEILQNSLNAAGSAQREYDTYLESTEAHLQQFQAKLVETYSTFINGDMISHVADLGTAILDLVNKTDLLKHSLVVIATIKIGQGITAAGGAIAGTVSQMRTLGNALQMVKNLPLEKVLRKSVLDEIGESTKSLTEKNLKLLLSQKQLSEADAIRILKSHELTKEEALSKLEKMGLTTATNANTAANTANAGSVNTLKGAFTGLTASVKAAWAAMSTLQKASIIFAAISTAWSIGSSIINSMKQRTEELRQATEESANAYKESTSSIEDYTKRYQELRQALLEAKGNEEETYNIKKQLLELQTELNDKFGEEYGKLNLVTDAYKDQTEAIKAYNKEAAQTFLNENHDGIEDAANAMTKERSYNLSYNGMSEFTDKGKALKEIAQKYEDKGISISEDENGATFKVVLLDVDAQSAYDTINEFENDIRAKAKELGDEHIFDDVLEISSAELNSAKEIIDKYGNIYKQALMAEIVTDDDRASTYNEALKAVEEYNEAVLSSEDPFNDENVTTARTNLEVIRNEIKNNAEEWEKYSAVTDELFDQADTRLLDFYNELQNNSGLQKFAEQLRGLDRTDLLAMRDDEYHDEFDSLANGAERYGVEVEELIDLLVRLGIAQDDISSKSSQFEDTRWDYSTTLQNLDDIKEKLEVLDKSYARLFNSDEKIGFDDLSAINEAFANVEGIDNYVKRIQEAGQNTEEVTAIMEELITSYLECSGVLDNVTQENAELIASMLDEMGIANASELVNYALAESNAAVAAQKIIAANVSLDLANVTALEIEQLIKEANESELTKQKLALLALQKQMCNDTIIRTDGDIQNLQALAEQAGATAASIASIKSLNDRLKNAENSRFYTNDPERLKTAWNREYNRIYADIQKQAKLDRQQAVSNGGTSPVKYNGGSNTNKAIEQARKGASSAAKEAEDTFNKTIDFFEQRVKVLQNAFENLEKGMSNVFGADAKNTLVTAQIGIVDEQINNYTDALAMYRQKANDALSGVSADLRDKIVNGAVQITDFIGKGNEEVVEAIENYQGWADKVADCTQKLEELKTQIRQLELQKFNNIMEEFNNQFNIRDDSIDLIKKQIGLLEQAGELIGESFYSKQIEQSQKKLDALESERVRLVQQLNDAISSGRIQHGTDEWLEMQNALSEVEGDILDCKTAMEEFSNELLNLNWQIFERVQTEFGNISSELGNLADLFDDFNEIRVSDGEGTWTNQAIATLGLYAQQLELAKYQVGQYGNAIENLNKDYLAGKYSATEYMEKLADLSQGQWDAVKSAESLEDAIFDLNKTRVDEEIEVIEDAIDAYKEYTDAQIEALDAAKNLHDYQKEIADKTKSVADLERQIAAMQNDNSTATIAKRKKLEEELAKSKEDLAEAEYNHSIESQKDALNKNLEDFENARNAEIEALKASLENRELLISNSLETVKINASLVGQEIANIATEHGVIVSDVIISSWKSGENAIASYGAVLSEQSSAFIGNIIGVQNYVYGLQAQANTTANSLAWMFSTRADNLVQQLTSSYYSEANLNAMTNTLQNSLINTLERGYNINGITSALSSIASGADAVASAANRAASALANMGAQQSVQGNHGYKVYDSYSGKLLDTVRGSYSDLLKKYDNSARGIRVEKFAKGGIISKRKDSPFDEIARAVGEDKLVAVKGGEGVLTVEQVKAIREFTPVMENMNKLWNTSSIGSGSIPEAVSVKQRPNVTLHYDKMFEFNGDFNNSEQLLRQMQKVAKGATTKILNDIDRDFGICCK